MGNVRHVLIEIITNIAYIASDPIFIILAILLIYVYKREVRDAKDIIYKNQVERTAVKDIFRGMIIGAIVSLMLTSLGICIPITKGMLILIPITIVLVLINPKWGCFSYVVPIAYGIWIIGKIFGKNFTWFELYYEQLIVLIGILHMIEGGLVSLYGHENARKLPVYQNRHLVSGFVLRKYWPVPLLIFEYQESGIMLIPIYAVLAYADLTLSKQAKKKSKMMGCILMLYGIVITLLGYNSWKYHFPIGIIMLMMPILHEGMFLVNHKLKISN